MDRKGWVPRKLDELGFVGRGRSRHRPRNAPQLYGGPYPFIQTAEIESSELYILEHKQTYSEMGLAQSRMWDKNTLCITIAGENTGESAILTFSACFPDSVIGFVADPSKADVRFVKYYLDWLKPRLRSITKGATQDNLSLDKLFSFDILTPPVYVQKRISSVIGAYDELITNNILRVKTLLKIGQALFQEWFVKFRFPGHEGVSLVDSEIGKVPNGWLVANLGELADFIRGIEPGSGNYYSHPKSGLIRFLRVGDFAARPVEIFIPVQMASNRLLDPDDVALTLDGSVGIVRTGLAGCYSTGIRKVVPHEETELGRTFLFYLLQSDRIQGIIRAHARGTTILHAGSAVSRMIFALPPASLLGQFEQIAGPVLQMVVALGRMTDQSRAVKNLLLPKLISGELDVTDLDIKVEDDKL